MSTGDILNDRIRDELFWILRQALLYYSIL